LLSITLKQRRQRQPQNAPASSGVLAQYLEFTTDFGCQNPSWRFSRAAWGPAHAAPDTQEDLEEQQFAAEADLRDFLADNPTCIEPGLRLYEAEGRSGIEYAIDDGYIDLLMIDREGKFLVIELKLGRGRNKTVGQLLYYMGWVDEHLGSAPCRGMIIAKEISDDLRVAARRVPGVSLCRYTMSVAVHHLDQ
ncbi:MAG: endonuclease NucS domain-containing protein, partial [Thermoguttaceae bacterium]